MMVRGLASPATMGCVVRGRFEARRLLPLALLVAGCGADLTKITACTWEQTDTQECDDQCLDMGTGSGSREVCRENLYENDGVPGCGGTTVYYNSEEDSCYVCDGDGTGGTFLSRHMIDYCSEITACADGWQPSADGRDCDPSPTPAPTAAPVPAPTSGCASHYTFVANNLASSLYAGETTAASTADCCEACDGSSYECLAVEYKASTGACWFLYADWSFYLSASTAQSSGWEGCLRSDGVAVSKNVDSSGAALIADGAASLRAAARSAATAPRRRCATARRCSRPRSRARSSRGAASCGARRPRRRGGRPRGSYASSTPTSSSTGAFTKRAKSSSPTSRGPS